MFLLSNLSEVKYWIVLVSELEVRYNYSGVKKNWRKIRKKNTRPLRFHQNDFHFQSRFCAEPTQWNNNAIILRFLYGNEAIALHSIKYISKKKGIDKNNLCDYTPTNKQDNSQPIASDIFFNLLIFVRSVNWFIKFLFTLISLQRSATVLFLSFSSFFIFSTILFFIFMCLFGRILCYSCVCSGQI